MSNKHQKTQSEALYLRPARNTMSFGFHHTSLCGSVKMCWNFPLKHSCGQGCWLPDYWGTAWSVPRHWASCQETWFLCYLLHYLSSLVRVHWKWLWSCDLFWPIRGGHARKQVVSWASEGPHDSLLFWVCQQHEKNLPWAAARNLQRRQSHRTTGQPAGLWVKNKFLLMQAIVLWLFGSRHHYSNIWLI